MNDRVKTIAGTGLLMSIVIVFQLIANYVTIGNVISFNLALIPIVVGSIIYGPWAGALLGLVDGAIILTAPSTQIIFMNYSVIWTIVLCLLKTSVAGLISGFLFKLLKRKPLLGSIVSSVSVPLINTGLFVVGAILIFKNYLIEYFSLSSEAAFIPFLFLTLIGINFIVEFTINAALSPVVYRLINNVWVFNVSQNKVDKEEIKESK